MNEKWKETNGQNVKMVFQSKSYDIVESRECEWQSFFYKTDAEVKKHLRELFFFKIPSREEELLQNIKLASLYGYVQYDNHVLDYLRKQFVNCRAISKNTTVRRQKFGPLKQECTEVEGFLSQPRRMLMSNFELNNGTILTPLLLL